MVQKEKTLRNITSEFRIIFPCQTFSKPMDRMLKNLKIFWCLHQN